VIELCCIRLIDGRVMPHDTMLPHFT